MAVRRKDSDISGVQANLAITNLVVVIISAETLAIVSFQLQLAIGTGSTSLYSEILTEVKGRDLGMHYS